MIYSTYYALKEKNIDIIFASTTPLTIGIPAWILKNYLIKMQNLSLK